MGIARTESLFLVSVALFLAGITFVVAGARSMKQTPAVTTMAASPDVPPVASIKQLMDAIVLPSATKVYDAVGWTSTVAGTVETKPQTDEEWAAIAAASAALVESGHLLLAQGRAIDRGEWVAQTQALVKAAQTAMTAATAKDVDGIFMAGGDLNETCDTCHERYQRR